MLSSNISIGDNILASQYNNLRSDVLADHHADTLGTKLGNSAIDVAAGIVESKLSLNYATHSNVNDPSAGEKAALAGTSGTPGSGNKYVTNDDTSVSAAASKVVRRGAGGYMSIVNADIAAGAGIVESKLSLNYATHSNANDPSAGEKAALVGTGTPGSGDKYINESDNASLVKAQFTYGETISAGDWLYLKNSDGKAYKADADNLLGGRLDFLGKALEAGVANDVKFVQIAGIADVSALTLTEASSGTDQQQSPGANPMYSPHYIDDANDMVSQAFRIGDKIGNISAVKIYLSKISAPNCDIVVAIRAIDANGKPTGSDLVSQTLAATSLTTSLAEYTFTFTSAYSVNPGDEYCIVVYPTNIVTLDGSNYVRVGGNNSLQPTWYTDYVYSEQPSNISYYSTDGGTSWISNPKLYFKTEYTQIKHTLGDYLYLSAVAGAITLNRPSAYPYILGKLLSSTQLLIKTGGEEHYIGSLTVTAGGSSSSYNTYAGVPPKTRKILIEAYIRNASYPMKTDLILTKEKTVAYMVEQEIGNVDGGISFTWSGNIITLDIIGAVTEYQYPCKLYFYT